MTMRSWKKEFYPISAQKEMSVVDAVKHSIKKWEGLSKENLDKHNVIISPFLNALNYKDTYFEINNNTCALCVLFIDNPDKDSCHGCPLYEIGRGCNATKSGWRKWTDNQNSDVMFADLRKALIYAENNM